MDLTMNEEDRRMGIPRMARRVDDRGSESVPSKRIGRFVVACLVAGSFAIGVSPGQSLAASSCVNPGGTGGCSATIQAAVDAAGAGGTITVAAGTYSENVVISKPLTLQGAGAATTIINAVSSNPKEGIIVQNVTSGGGATISGLTVQNAALSGIGVFDSSHIRIENTIVQNNDKNLQFDQQTQQGSCAGAEPFDQDDCGEGLHLRGVTDSQVLNNVVQGNAGGILLTDESGATSGNMIRGNTVQNNILDCGITLASHPAAIVPPTSPGGQPTFLPGHGIFKNQVMNNVVDHNGAAGVGLFASVPGTGTYDNLVQGNTITNNGLPGVTMHSHAPGQNLNDNKIINNTISGNAIGASILGVGPGDPDAGDTQTTGILVMSAVVPVQGTIITGNTLTKQDIGIWLTNTVGTTIAGNKIDAAIPYYEVSASALPTEAGPRNPASIVAGMARVGTGRAGTSASFAVTFTSKAAGQGYVMFGPGPGCNGLVEVATRDAGAGTTHHAILVTGNDLPGTVGDIGIVPGTTYSYEVVTVTASGTEIDNNGGACYSVTVGNP
jgi:parallel beta-helix repeat protein